jgi:predicted ATPase/class 3 adenylate cyclase
MPHSGRAHERLSKHPVSLPTGTVTFLFSDIEGSTERWETHHHAMKAAVARHEQLVRLAISRYGGYVFKTVGDAFCSAFATAPNAVRGAVEAQRELGKEDFSAVNGLRVRMGLHTGYAEERDADYFGPAVNRVTRLMSIGHGGQVLLSATTHELVQDEAPHETTFTDLGLHRLRDLAQPEHVWQVSAKGLPTDFPPLKSLDTLPNNLPIQVTSFRGREQDLEDLKAHLAEHRLVTLLGAGGVGKTRLAAQLGGELLERFPDGVWIADLAPITDSELVSSVVAKVVGVSQTQGRLVDESMTQSLKGKQLLLVLDSCEHVLEAAAAVADAIHRHCPNVRILATSREALGVGGEKVLRLASLAVPDKTLNLDAASAIKFGAVALFADRALLVDQSFRLGDDNAPLVSDICRRLDGIPLAIELAAARVKVLSIPNLAQRLNERFKILTGGSRTALPRQKTLRALFDWSYDLLSPEERALFNRVAIFAGSFTLDAAGSVCADHGIDQNDVLDLVASLSDKSLVVADTTGDQERYRVLESTRQYALGKLEASGERERLARRHADYFLDAARKADASFGAVPLSEWLARLEPEVENFRATMDWALGRGQQVALGGSVASALVMFWWHGGAEAEGLRWINAALDKIDEREQADVAAHLRQALARLMSRVLYS